MPRKRSTIRPEASPAVAGNTDVAGESSTASRRLQMADIARMAGVSTATVSRALNGSPLVSADTRERIEALARSLHYAINLGAKNLRQRTNNTIGVVIPFSREARQPISDPFFLAMLGALADALTERGFDMLLSRVDSESLDAAAHLVDGGVAIGVILIGQWDYHDQLNALAARHVPIAVWGAQLPQQLYCTVGGDNTEGGLIATRHLLDQGSQRVVFLGDARLPEVSFRYRGYLEAHRARRLRVDERLCLTVPFDADMARAALSTLCESGVPFDAVFACSDVLASAAIQALHHHGLAVPDDVSVVGFDDSPLAVHTNPPLTTVRQPISRAGDELVDVLLRLIGGQQEPPRTLPVELVVRGSTRPR
jgi:DNA-binding LacI/PurR family transcriptional regulator